MSGRMSQASFMRATKDLQFQGDAKLIWVLVSAWLRLSLGVPRCPETLSETSAAKIQDTLTRGVPGFLSVEERFQLVPTIQIQSAI